MVDKVVAASRSHAVRATSVGRGGWAVRLVVELPDRLPVVLGCLTLPALGATLLGQFRPFVVLPAWILLVAVTWRLVPAAPAGSRVGPVAGLLALVGGWSWWGVATSGQYLVVARDPGFLTLKAWWLVDHPSARIPVGSALQGAVAGASAGTDGFTVHGGVLLSQGNSALPALLATVGWAGGHAAVLWANVLVGAVAIVAVFAVGRRLMAPPWALLAAVGVAVCLPVLAFTRSAYTEPLVLALTFGGVALLAGARDRPSWGAFALAGGMVGAAAAARIDGALVVAGAALGLACVVLAAPRPDERRRLARYAAVSLGTMGAVAALGLVDLVTLSPSYLHDLGHQLTLLLGGTAALLVTVAAVLDSRLREWVRRLLVAHRVALGRVGQALVVVGFVALASRPLWLTVHGAAPGGATAQEIAELQAAEGLPVDGTRTYDELTVTWLAWYLGWSTVVAAVVGAVVVVRRIVARRDVPAAVLASMAVAGSVLYLVTPAITPDQVWAVRRLLPVALPTAVLLAVLAVATAWRRRSWQWRVPAALVAIGMIAVPVTTWFPVAWHRELGGQLTLVDETCAALGRVGADHVVWVKSAPWKYLATLRVVCGVDVVEFTDNPSQDQLAQVARSWGGTPIVLSEDPTPLGFDPNAVPFVPNVVGTQWQQRISGPPRSVLTRNDAVWAWTLGADGTLTPLADPVP